MTFMQKFMDMLYMDNVKNSVRANSKYLSKIYNGTLEKRKEEIVSRDILSTIGLCSTPNICSEAKQYLSSNPTRTEICLHAVELCTPAINNNELYLIAHAFQWAGAKYRNKAIIYTRDYIENGAVSDYIQSYILHEHGYSYDQRIKFIAIEHQNLADLYSKEYMFDEAISELKQSLQIAPYLIGTYPTIAQNYVKLGDYDAALSALYAAKKNKYYKLNGRMKDIIDASIKNTIQKRDSGYIYKPRKSKKL